MTRKGKELSVEKRAELELELTKVEAKMEELAEQRQKKKEEQKAEQQRLIIDGVEDKVKSDGDATREKIDKRFDKLEKELKDHTRPQLDQIGLMSALSRYTIQEINVVWQGAGLASRALSPIRSSYW